MVGGECLHTYIYTTIPTDTYYLFEKQQQHTQKCMLILTLYTRVAPACFMCVSVSVHAIRLYGIHCVSVNRVAIHTRAIAVRL